MEIFVLLGIFLCSVVGKRLCCEKLVCVFKFNCTPHRTQHIMHTHFVKFTMSTLYRAATTLIQHNRTVQIHAQTTHNKQLVYMSCCESHFFRTIKLDYQISKCFQRIFLRIRVKRQPRLTKFSTTPFQLAFSPNTAPITTPKRMTMQKLHVRLLKERSFRTFHQKQMDFCFWAFSLLCVVGKCLCRE